MKPSAPAGIRSAAKAPIKTWSTPVRDEGCRIVPCAICGGEKFKPRLSCEGFSYVRCATCGLVQINPQPSAEEVQNRYRRSSGDDYLAYELKNESAFLNLQKLALADAGFFDIEKGLMGQGRPSVLDAGCATGALLAFLRDRGWQATGVEISLSGEYARKERGLDVRSLSLEDCHFPADNFDLAHASHLLEHLNSPGLFIRELRRILRPGAWLLLTTPNIGGFQARLLGSRWRSAIFDHLYLFSKGGIRSLLKKHGFSIEGIYTWGGLAAGLAPPHLKAFADKTAKALGCGDVMLVKARKIRNEESGSRNWKTL